MKNTSKGDLFVILREPDIDLLEAADGKMQVRINGMDVFHPATYGEVATGRTASRAGSSIPITTRKASLSGMRIFLGANDPYKALEDYAEGGDCLGHAAQRSFAAVCEAGVGADRG